MEIKNIINSKKLEHVYQPLWNVSNWKVYGYEGLLRLPEEKNFNPENLFKMARTKGCLFELDTYSIKHSIEHFPFLQLNQHLLFLNVYPSTLLHEEFEKFIRSLIKEHPEIQGRIVFELNETREEEYIWDIPDLKEKISTLKHYGFYVALDDVGKGAATFQKLIEFNPNYIKLDRYFAKELAVCKEKQQLISSLVHYCHQKIILILEGIEKDVDLAQAKMLNIPIVQGYLLGEPQKLSLEKASGSPLFLNSIFTHV